MLLAVNWPLSFERPAWLLLMLVIPAIVVISQRSLAGLDRPRRILAVTLRSLVVVCLALALARIQYVKRSENVAVMFVLDRSRSVPDVLRKDAQDYVRKVARRADRDDRLGIIGFDGEADLDLIASRGGLDVQGFGMAVEPDHTDLSAGLRLAMAAFPEGFGRRVILVTDGNENTGNLAEEIEAARANNIVVDVIPLDYQHENEILLDRLVVPAHASKDTKVPLRLIAKSRKPTRVKLTLYHQGRQVPLGESTLDLTGSMKPDRFTIPIELHGGGIHRFEAHVEPVTPGADSVPENNVASAFTFVEDQGRVLIVSQPGAPDDRALYEALQREQIEVEMADAQMPLDLLKLQEYAVVVLANVSADLFNGDQQKALASYVKDFGGGLIMTGGDQGFGAGGWIGTPVEQVSPVSFEVKHKKVMPRGALAIVMHSCEIPKGNYWGEQVAIAAVQTISSLDYLGVICFSPMKGGPNWDVPLAPATDKAGVIAKIKAMTIGDMPDFATTMDIAVRDLLALRDVSQRHMIIISDGDPQPPSPATLQRMVNSQITCSTVGIGYGSHVMEAPLQRIASATKGRFYACRNPRQLPQIFVKEAKVVKRPLVDDRPFTPRLPFSFAQTTQGLSDGELPGLGGLVLTSPKPDAVVPMIRRSTDGDDPVLAHWNYEMGKMAVFTSGWWPKWGTDWVAWEKFGKFWAQLVRWAMRQSGSGDFDIYARVEGTQGRISIEALNKDASYLNFLNFRGRLVGPSDEKPLSVTQTGPGQYEATFDITEHGNYAVSLQYTGANNEKGLITTGVTLPYSPEFRELGANTSLLQRVAERTGGRVLDMNADAAKVFSRDLPPSVARQPVWRWVVQWLLIPLFLLDVAGRRLASVLALSVYVEVAVFVVAVATCFSAWGGRPPIWTFPAALVLAEAVGWTIRRRYLVPTIRFFTSGAFTGERSAEALSQLKGVREKVREGLGQSPEAEGRKTRPVPGVQESVPLESVVNPGARFDAGDKADAAPAGDLTESLGGANAADVAAAERMKTPPPAASDLAARLRKAKQRARDQIDDRTEGNE